MYNILYNYVHTIHIRGNPSYLPIYLIIKNIKDFQDFNEINFPDQYVIMSNT